MKPRSAVLLALLSAGFVYQPNRTPAPRSKNEAETAQPAREALFDTGKLEVKDWPRATLHEFFGTPSLAAAEPENRRCLLTKQTPVDFVVATIPDPENSRYPYMFDRFVEMISRAAEDAGYTRDRYWLPWEAGTAPQETDWLKRERHQQWRTAKQESPGILVFRSLKLPLKVLGVLLVGENSVSGINKRQFAHALDVVVHFDGENDPKLRILGPTFSGSATSLGIAIGTIGKEKGFTKYTMITGSATGSDIDRTIRGLAAVEEEKSFQFLATIWNDRVAQSGFREFLVERGVNLKQVAILTESGTQYGRGFDVRTRDPKPSEQGVLTAQYPMEISRLRNAYADDSELSALSGTDPSASQQRLSLKLKTLPGSADSTPAFSQTISPISQEAGLLETLAMLSRRRIEYVGIVASDILDAIFLARMVRQHCPDARLFLFNSDLIYGDVAQNRVFQGMLIVTTYPLFSQAQVSGGLSGRGRYAVFPNDTAEGVYNACRLLLRNGQPGMDTPLADYSPPFWENHRDDRQQRPALWLAVVGRDGLWPVTTLPVADDKDLRGSTQPVADPNSGKTESDQNLPFGWLPRVWILMFWLMTLFSALFAAAILYINRGTNQASLVRHTWVSLLWASNSPAKLLLAIACTLLLAAYGTVTLIQTSYLGSTGRDLLFSAPAIPVSGLLLLSAIWCWPRSRNWMSVAGVACVCLVASALVVYLHPSAQASFAWIYRGIHLGSGVSPILPFLLLLSAFLWYLAAHLNRIRLSRSMSLSAPASASDTCLARMNDHYRSVLNSLSRSWLGGWSWTAASIVVFSILVCWRFHMRIGSLEGRLFGDGYLLGLFVLYSMLLFACARFLRLWSGLRVILLMLERSPLQKAFKRLGRHKELSPAAVWRWGGGATVDITLPYAIERLRTVAEQRVIRPVGEWHDFDYEGKLADLEKTAEPLISARCSGAPLEKGALERVASIVTEVWAHLVNTVLTRTTRNQPARSERAAVAVASTAAVPAPVVSPPRANNEAEEFVALRFVALIRLVSLNLKNTLEFAAGALILLVLSLVCYPFEPHHQIMTVITICFFAMSAAFLSVFVQMSRNMILSHLNGTVPGKLDANFWRVLQFGGLPLLAVLSAQFPSIGGFLFAWVKPALENLR